MKHRGETYVLVAFGGLIQSQVSAESLLVFLDTLWNLYDKSFFLLKLIWDFIFSDEQFVARGRVYFVPGCEASLHSLSPVSIISACFKTDHLVYSDVGKSITVHCQPLPHSAETPTVPLSVPMGSERAQTKEVWPYYPKHDYTDSFQCQLDSEGFLKQLIKNKQRNTFFFFFCRFGWLPLFSTALQKPVLPGSHIALATPWVVQCVLGEAALASSLSHQDYRSNNRISNGFSSSDNNNNNNKVIYWGLCAKHCGKILMWIILFNSHNNSKKPHSFMRLILQPGVT